jgi:hypothetical protein
MPKVKSASHEMRPDKKTEIPFPSICPLRKNNKIQIKVLCIRIFYIVEAYKNFRQHL